MFLFFALLSSTNKTAVCLAFFCKQSLLLLENMYDLILSFEKTGNLQYLITNIENVPKKFRFCITRFSI